MAQYIYIDNLSNSGKMAISVHVFDNLVASTIKKMESVSVSNKQMKKNQKIRLNRPVQTSIKKGIVHVKVSVDIKKGMKVVDASRMLQDEITSVLLASAETIPFDVQVKVDSII